MKYIILGLALLYAVNGKSFHYLNNDDNIEYEDNNDFTKNIRARHTGQKKHQRDARYAYDYDPFRGNHYKDQDFDKILQYLDEISWYMRRAQTPAQPPAPAAPQIIYVPVPYPVPQTINNNCKCPNGTFTTKADLDPNQIWGSSDTYKFIDDGKDGKRPISFDEAVPKETIPEPPPVDHGSSQAGIEVKVTERPVPTPGLCHAAIIVCCGLNSRSDQENCFMKYNCPKTFATGLSCSPEVVRKSFEMFEEKYSLNSR